MAKTTFFPLLCRTSKKDVKLTNYCRDHSSSSSSSTDDPSSPKVSCIGQIRRTNKVIAFSPTPHRLTSASATTKTTATAIVSGKTHSLGNYTVLGGWFTCRNVGISVASTTTGCGSGGGSSKSSCSSRCSRINYQAEGVVTHVRVDIDDLEPPLPVVFIVNQVAEVNLWKRRCGGVALKSLEPISR